MTVHNAITNSYHEGHCIKHFVVCPPNGMVVQTTVGAV